MTRLGAMRVAAVVLTAATLGACGSNSTTTTAPPAAGPASSTSSSSSSAGGATVAMAKTSLGNVVVDAKGMTLYMFTKDTQNSGKSSCTGQCLTAWPPLFADGTPTGDGVTGKLATIDTPDGKKQVTLDGWPLYYFAKDKAAGDVTGQGVGKVWWVLDATGKPMEQAPSAADSSGGY